MKSRRKTIPLLEAQIGADGSVYNALCPVIDAALKEAKLFDESLDAEYKRETLLARSYQQNIIREASKKALMPSTIEGINVSSAPAKQLTPVKRKIAQLLEYSKAYHKAKAQNLSKEKSQALGRRAQRVFDDKYGKDVEIVNVDMGKYTDKDRELARLSFDYLMGKQGKKENSVQGDNTKLSNTVYITPHNPSGITVTESKKSSDGKYAKAYFGKILTPSKIVNIDVSSAPVKQLTPVKRKIAQLLEYSKAYHKAKAQNLSKEKSQALGRRAQRMFDRFYGKDVEIVNVDMGEYTDKDRELAGSSFDYLNGERERSKYNKIQEKESLFAINYGLNMNPLYGSMLKHAYVFDRQINIVNPIKKEVDEHAIKIMKEPLSWIDPNASQSQILPSTDKVPTNWYTYYPTYTDNIKVWSKITVGVSFGFVGLNTAISVSPEVGFISGYDARTGENYYGVVDLFDSTAVSGNMALDKEFQEIIEQRRDGEIDFASGLQLDVGLTIGYKWATGYDDYNKAVLGLQGLSDQYSFGPIIYTVQRIEKKGDPQWRSIDFSFSLKKWLTGYSHKPIKTKRVVENEDKKKN